MLQLMSKKSPKITAVLLLTILLGTMSCRRVVQTESVEISVSGVVMRSGEPLANIEVGLFWFGASIPNSPSVFATTDADGRYEMMLRAGYCAASRVYAYPDGLVPPWRAPLRGELLSGCGPHVSNIDGWAGAEAR